MPSTSPAILDVRFVPRNRVHAVVQTAIRRLQPGGQVIVVCDEEAIDPCRAVVEAHEQTGWEVLDAPVGFTYARITRRV